MNSCNINKTQKKKKVATKLDLPKVAPVVSGEQQRDDSVISFDSDDEDIDLGDVNTSFLERRKINELDEGETYVMEHVERTTTKFGDAILATLNDVGDRFKVFLPKRFNGKLTDEHIQYANTNTLLLKYLGCEGYNDLEFKKQSKDDDAGNDILLQDFNTAFLERRKINELDEGETYVMEHVERTTTKFGDALIATLNDEGERFKVFLPKRFNATFTGKHIKYVNKNTLLLKYLGGEFRNLEFSKCTAMFCNV